MNRAELGQFGEDVAVRFLQAHGWTVVERNWRCRSGEIDIIARDGGLFVFCEVKARSGAGFGDPLEAVTRAKLQRLRELVGHWLGAYPGPRQVRIDAIAVIAGDDQLLLRHVRGIA
ncbi:YraN family protein [Naumannella halotolerans]|uniref:UPF0102 protein CLV29_0643 n=1 Tax=Naumannella halotolerans TaxID=993414 RepID=A0A4V3ENA8_9ACTN|nr:YraN family protein [Naumannella halotolerans]TDT33048.1 putative endonuclease [Naumannella halotolerans]